MSQLFLVGPMGVGKTTIGKKIARKLETEFADTDKLIIANHGPISEIFETHGEEHFRDLEQETLASLNEFQGIIATGGGVVTTEANRHFLKGKTVVYLSTRGNQMKTRLLSSKKRPLLKNGYQDWKRIYEERKPLYESVATEVISVDGTPLNTVAERCVEIYRRYQDA